MSFLLECEVCFIRSVKTVLGSSTFRLSVMSIRLASPARFILIDNQVAAERLLSSHNRSKIDFPK